MILDRRKIMNSDIISERKEKIIKATIKCISDLGYHNFSIQDVASSAKVSKGMIHYYFMNKDDLILGVLERMVCDIEKKLLEKISHTDNCKNKLQDFLSYLFYLAEENKEYYQPELLH